MMDAYCPLRDITYVRINIKGDDLIELEKLVSMNLEKGVDGFYVGRNTAEVYLLSLEERKYILDIVMHYGKGKCKIISRII